MTRAYAFAGRQGAALLLALLTLAPIALVLLRSIVTPDGITVDHYREAFGDPANLQAIVNTIVISLATVVFAVALAIPMAWLVSRTDLPGARRFRVLLVVPYV